MDTPETPDQQTSAAGGTDPSNPIGFLGVGKMGRPMALNLLRSGMPTLVWNRTVERSTALRDAGAMVALSVDEVFERSQTVLMMLANGAVIDDVLGRGTSAFGRRVSDRTVVSMGTTSPLYSARLAEDVRGAGGRYVEAPVLGSVKPAEDAQLVFMIAGDPADVQQVKPLARTMSKGQIECGDVPSALTMKLSVNVFLIGMVAALTESVHFAGAQGVDLGKLAEVINAGPMGSAVSMAKLSKLVDREFSAQASIADVHYNNRLIIEVARQQSVASPVLDACNQLLSQTEDMGHEALDMTAILLAYEVRTKGLRRGRQR